jgi:kumamolisin
MLLSFADELVPVPGSERKAWPGAKRLGPVDPDEEVEVTVWLRPRKGGKIDLAQAQAIGETLPRRRAYAARDELRRKTAADPADIELLRAYLQHHHVAVVQAAWRCVVARGTIGALSRAVGTDRVMWEDDGQLPFRYRRHSLHVPGEIAEFVRGVFGLDDWPQYHAVRRKTRAAAQAREQAAAARLPEPLLADALARSYAFPGDADGTGQTIGILQFGGKFERADFEACMRLQRVTPATVVSGIRDAAISKEAEFNFELALDTQVAGALAAGAKLVLYAAPYDERGFLDAIRAAVFDEEHRPGILSISYGWRESLWTRAALQLSDELFAAAALLGVTVFCASGDHGAEIDPHGKPHVLAPASSPFAHACGGTALVSEDGQTVERAWSDTGGGFSERPDSLPAWQVQVKSVAERLEIRPGRGVPDVAAQVLPGYRVIIDGKRTTQSGTSAVAPLWSALVARINQKLQTPVGFFAPLLYAKANRGVLFRPITSGCNGYYRARRGWNPCTGLGSPVGTEIVRALSEPAEA